MLETRREEGQLLVSEEATASGAVNISPTDMDGNAVTLNNDTEQVSNAVLHRYDALYVRIMLV